MERELVAENMTVLITLVALVKVFSALDKGLKFSGRWRRGY